MKETINKTSIKVEYFQERLKLSWIYGTLRNELTDQRFNFNLSIWQKSLRINF